MRSHERLFILWGMADEPTWPGWKPSVASSWPTMSRIVVAPGSFVHQGQLIGYVGSTGLSTGPHLHYEVLKDGRAVNPTSVKLAAAPAQLQGEKLHAFQGALRSLMVLPAAGGGAH